MTFWARRDPRARLWVGLVLSFALAAAPVDRALWALPAAFALAATAGPRRLWGVLRAAAALWALSLAVNAFLVPGQRLGPAGLGWLRPTAEGLLLGLGQGARLGALAAVASWIAGVLGALELAASLEWTVRARPRWRARVHRTLAPLVLAVRILPLLVDEARRLAEVDRLRRGPVRGPAALLRPARLAPAWMVLVLERAEDLALALSLRGYRPAGERGFARAFRPGAADWGVALAAAAGAAVVAWRG